MFDKLGKKTPLMLEGCADCTDRIITSILQVDIVDGFVLMYEFHCLLKELFDMFVMTLELSPH